jgi:hypothetical protein
MDPNHPSVKQIILFTVLLSFFVSVIGTVLTSGFLIPLDGAESSIPFSFARPLEKITEKVLQKEVNERVLRQDELIVGAVEKASPAVVSIIATKDVPVLKQYFVDPFADDPLFRVTLYQPSFQEQESGSQIGNPFETPEKYKATILYEADVVPE